MSAGDGNPMPEELLAAVEAVLFAAGEPVRPADLAEAFGLAGERQAVEILEALGRTYEGQAGGLAVEKVAGGYRLATRSSLGAWVRRFLRQRNRARLSPAALEILAIVAYRQPITAPEIQEIRGVDPAGPLRGLLEKKLVRILGRKKVVGSPFLYGTTHDFLVHFGLDRLEDLPSLEEFDEVLGAMASGAEAPRAPLQDRSPEGAPPEAGSEVSGKT